MQWVVTTGRTVDEARDRAIDALGIDESEVELEVLDEPRSTLFGLRRTEARVRARVRPTRPRPKVDRRNRRKANAAGGRRRRTKRGDERAAETSTDDAAEAPADASEAAASGGGARTGSRSRRRGRNRSGDAAADEQVGEGAEQPSTPASGSEPAPADPGAATEPATTAPAPASTSPAQPPPSRRARASTPIDDSDEPPSGATGDSMSDISLDEQQPTALGFVQGLVDAFGLDADVEAVPVDEEHLEISVTGEDLGLLVGPRGATLNAIQELTRTAVAQQQSGRLQGRLRVDVAGYRARRKEALERFAAQQAERVKETGTPVALEPMSPPDRKIVHDAINEIEGVRTTSEGEDRRRHVVILPD